MSDRDFEIGGRAFKVSKIDAFKQFHIARRIGPILADLMPAMKSAKNGKFTSEAELAKLSEEQKMDLVTPFVQPIMTGLSKLSEADADAVLKGLLTAVEVQQQPTKNWARVVVGDQLMIQDLDLPTMMQLAGRAFMYNLAGFFAAAPGS